MLPTVFTDFSHRIVAFHRHPQNYILYYVVTIFENMYAYGENIGLKGEQTVNIIQKISVDKEEAVL